MAGPSTARRLATLAAPPAMLAASLLVGFAGLVADPSALIVDGERPWVDEGDRPGSRPIGNDLTGLFLPRFLWQAEHWRAHGRAPLWDPRGFAGRPNAGNPQAGPWYPPVRLAWAWGAPSGLGWLTVAHLLGAGVGAFATGRAVGLGRPAATVSGVVLMLNPYVMAQVHEGHLPHVWSACWVPWAFLGAILLRRGDRRGFLILPPSLALSLMAGHPQEGAYLALTLGIWAVFDSAIAIRRRLGGSPPPGGSPDRRLPARWAIALGLAVGLAAVEWLPVVMARPWAAGPLGGEGGGGSGPYHLHPSNLLQLVSPRALGGPAEYFGRGNHWETLLSIGWAPLVLAVVGAAGHPDRRGARAWGVLLLLSLMHAWGDALGLSRVVAKLPGLGGLRVPARSLFLAAPAAAMLAGLGVDAIARTPDRERASRRARHYGAAIVLLALLVASGLVAGALASRPPGGTSIGPARRWASACSQIACDPITIASMAAVGAAFAWQARSPGAGRWASGAIGVVTVAELAASAALALPIAPPGRFLAPDTVSEALNRVRLPGPTRVRARDAFYPDLLAWRDGVEKTNLNDLFQIRHAAELSRALYALFDEPARGPVPPLDPPLIRAVLDRMAVDLIVTDRPARIAIGPTAASGVRDGTRFALIANPTALPRSYVVPRAEVGWGDDIAARLPEVDPRSAVLLESDPLRDLSGPRQAFSAASYAPIAADRILIRATTKAPSLLVVLDTWMPGWSASVDGRPAPVLRGDHAFCVVPLPEPGRHEILLAYRPPGLAAGSAITAGSALLLLSMCVIARADRPQPA